MDCGLVFFSFASTFGSISSQQIVRSIKSKKKKVRDTFKISSNFKSKTNMECIQP